VPKVVQQPWRRDAHRGCAVPGHLVGGWIHSRQLEVIDFLREENRVLREQLGGRRLRFTDDQRRRLAVKGRIVGRRRLGEFAGVVTPDTILRWYRELVAPHPGARVRIQDCDVSAPVTAGAVNRKRPG
jgi:hypothetical protein